MSERRRAHRGAAGAGGGAPVRLQLVDRNTQHTCTTTEISSVIRTMDPDRFVRLLCSLLQKHRRQSSNTVTREKKRNSRDTADPTRDTTRIGPFHRRAKTPSPNRNIPITVQGTVTPYSRTNYTRQYCTVSHTRSTNDRTEPKTGDNNQKRTPAYLAVELRWAKERHAPCTRETTDT